MNDVDAIAEINSGNIDAFEHIYNNNHQLVSSLVHKMCPYDNNVEDYIQEIFLTANNKLSQFKNEAKFSTWLYRIAVNYVLMKKRKPLSPVVPVRDFIKESQNDMFNVSSASDVELLDSLAKATLDTSSTFEIKEAVNKLPARYKKVFDLFFVDGYSMPEIATLLNVTHASVKMQIHRIRNILKYNL